MASTASSRQKTNKNDEGKNKKSKSKTASKRKESFITRGGLVASHKSTARRGKKTICTAVRKKSNQKVKDKTVQEILCSISQKLESQSDTCLIKLSEILKETVSPQLDLISFKTWQEAIEYLTETITREKANVLLKTKTNRETLFQETKQWEAYEKFRNEELFHCFFVRKCMNLLNPSGKNNLHDNSKDELYFFANICEYSLGRPVSRLGEYLKKHWSSEKHHPEYELANPDRITEQDIIETCVDKLSRNLQFNEGNYNFEQLKIYEPVYNIDYDIRLKIYKSNLEKLMPIIQKLWREERLETGGNKQNLAKLSDLIWDQTRNTLSPREKKHILELVTPASKLQEN